MSLEFIDGFDHYTGGATLGRKWDSISTIGVNAGSGRFGGNSIGGSIDGCTVTLSAQQTRVVGFAMMLATLGSGGIIAQMEDAGTTQVELRLTSTGAITVTRNGTLLGTSTWTLPTGTWYYFEWKVKIDSSAGTYEVHVSGGPGAPGTALIGSGANTQNTSNGTANQVRLFSFVNGGPNFDDVYILNTLGTVNKDFLGECRILTSLPTADSATNAAWTPDSGTAHFSRVNDSPTVNDDTSYVSSSTPGQYDTYTFATVSPTGAVAAVQTVMCCRKDDAGTRTIAGAYRGGGTNYDGASQNPASNYLMLRQIYEIDPATGLAWTGSGINAGEFGIKCVA